MTVTVIYAESSDQYVYNHGPTVQEAMAGLGNGGWDAAGGLYCGFYPLGGVYLYAAYLRFDTRPIGSDIVSEASLALAGSQNNTGYDFNLIARSLVWDGASGRGIWQNATELNSRPVVAKINTTDYSTGYMTFDSTEEFKYSIIGSDFTSITLHYEGMESVDPLPGQSYVVFKSADSAGTTEDPKITITHTSGIGPSIAPSAILL